MPVPRLRGLRWPERGRRLVASRVDLPSSHFGSAQKPSAKSSRCTRITIFRSAYDLGIGTCVNGKVRSFFPFIYGQHAYLEIQPRSVISAL